MERDEFLKSLGISLAMVCVGTCFESCGKKGGDETGEPESGNGQMASVDMSALASVGSKTIVNGVLFLRIAAGNTNAAFLATQATCTHAGGPLTWVASENKIQCQLHGAEFTTTGSVSKGPATTALKVYPITVTGTTLTVNKS
jgi:hypothetical protein